MSRQVFRNDEIGELSILSSTQAQLAASIITLGGLQYETPDLVMDVTTLGYGGIDAGSIAPNETYNLFAVLQLGIPGLILSLGDAPTGFTTYSKVGILFTTNSSNLALKINPKWQLKRMSSNNDYANMSFSNLTVGRTYRYSADLYMSGGDSATGNYYLNNGATQLFWRGIQYINTTVWPEKEHRHFEIIFIATDTSLTFVGNFSGFNFVGNGTADSCFAILEDITDIKEQTTEWI